MKHTVHSLTPEVLVEMFGDDKDWYSVLKNGKRVGSFADLRKLVLKRQALADAEERKKFHANLMKDDNIKEAKKYFDENLKNAEVFINETQPNIHINGSKCYIICGSSQKIRMSIMHKDLTFDEMQNISGLEGKPSTSKRHILFDGLTLEEAKDLIILLCGE
ncbi:transcription termination factor Alc [Acinetobacter baumannii]